MDNGDVTVPPPKWTLFVEPGGLWAAWSWLSLPVRETET